MAPELVVRGLLFDLHASTIDGLIRKQGI